MLNILLVYVCRALTRNALQLFCRDFRVKLYITRRVFHFYNSFSVILYAFYIHILYAFTKYAMLKYLKGRRSQKNKMKKLPAIASM